MCMDRSDRQYAAQQVCSKMTRPSKGSWTKCMQTVIHLMEVTTVARMLGAWDDEELHMGSWALWSER